jgi:two-component system OmpR family response regulator/two-component system response regulator QseB
MRLLLVEDDELLGDALRRGLQRHGWTVHWVKDGERALDALEREAPLAVVLDLGLPGRDGNEVLGLLRQRQHTLPVLVLTARETTQDKLRAFGVGADDYVVKPVDLEELAARLQALLRRSHKLPPAPYAAGDVVVDLAARRVWRAGNEVTLSGREFAVLEQLVANAGKVLTRTQLEDALYGWSEGAESNTLGVFIHHLRKKLGNEVILTLRGIGYMLVKP